VSVSVAIYVGIRGDRSSSGELTTPEAAVAATTSRLPPEVDSWNLTDLTRVTLVREASELSAVIPDIPASGLTRNGFPGPVWVVIWSGDLRCDSTRHNGRWRFILEASSGARLVEGGSVCPLFEIALGGHAP